ncbi:TetR/AcrR family transcriptional regulator [Qipengyuania atrilutea]|uniref:TetR/AcrR family transcriptional regulator n=1 Tax=Qipengyuania atrilutea TaxID=2744473 RepID=A0A850H7Y8_9SPHN|nr:TetR/AcrR family transcriptional regulator [Actirhodobacter atriluteus]NVD45913.1 TetR/AcrR family transcriptional regulator [Actirhodobacter atriluteus]
MEPLTKTSAATRRKSGRPLSFDRDAVLEKAMLAFWRHGYETTSISDLIRKMGISAPSLYAAFGDKKNLFLEAVGLYAGDTNAVRQNIEAAPSSYDAARSVLANSVETFTGADTPPGCLLASSTATGSAASEDVRGAVAAYRRELRDSLQARIERDIGEGCVPADVDPVALANLVVALLQGLSVMARDGADRASLLSVVEATMKGWPESTEAAGA